MIASDSAQPDTGTPLAQDHLALTADLGALLDLGGGLARALQVSPHSQLHPTTGTMEPGQDAYEHLVANLRETMRGGYGLANLLDSESGHAGLVADLSVSINTAPGLSEILNPLSPAHSSLPTGTPGPTVSVVVPVEDSAIRIRSARDHDRLMLRGAHPSRHLAAAMRELDAIRESLSSVIIYTVRTDADLVRLPAVFDRQQTIMAAAAAALADALPVGQNPQVASTEAQDTVSKPTVRVEPEVPPTFGTELRRLRLQVGLSLAELAGLTFYSKGYLSKIENDIKLPTSQLARRCDTALGANGVLASLVPEGLNKSDAESQTASEQPVERTGNIIGPEASTKLRENLRQGEHIVAGVAHESGLDDASTTNQHFGVELRRQRVAAGLSLAALAHLVYFSRSHLSRVENGMKPPSSELARRCDVALRANGALLDLVPGTSTRVGQAEPMEPIHDAQVLHAFGAAADSVQQRLQQQDRNTSNRAIIDTDRLMEFDQLTRQSATELGVLKETLENRTHSMEPRLRQQCGKLADSLAETMRMMWETLSDFRGADLRAAHATPQPEDLDGIRWSDSNAASGPTRWPVNMWKLVAEHSVAEEAAGVYMIRFGDPVSATARKS